MSNKDLGPCPLCGMSMIDGFSVDRHHLIPKSKSGTLTELCHVVCHRKVHHTFSEAELNSYWHTWERLKADNEIKKYVRWVRKQFRRDPEYIDNHRDTKARKRQR